MPERRNVMRKNSKKEKSWKIETKKKTKKNQDHIPNDSSSAVVLERKGSGNSGSTSNSNSVGFLFVNKNVNPISHINFGKSESSDNVSHAKLATSVSSHIHQGNAVSNSSNQSNLPITFLSNRHENLFGNEANKIQSNTSRESVNQNKKSNSINEALKNKCKSVLDNMKLF